MKRFYDSLKNGLFCPIYLFYGDEPLLVDEAIAALSRAYIPEDQGWDKEILDGESSTPHEAVAAALQISFFGGRRLIIVRNINWFEKKAAPAGDKKKPADETAPLLDYLQDPNPDSIIVLTLTGNVDKRRKTIQLIEKKGRLIACDTPKGAAKDIWLKQRLQQAGKSIDPRALSYISLSSGSLSQMAAEADKLCLYCGDNPHITLADAQQVVSKSSLFSIFELTDATAAKNAPQALAAYQQLLQQGEAEQQIFAMLAAQFRNMLAVQDMLQQGYASGDIARELALHPFVVEKCSRQCRQFSPRQIIKALEILLAADLAQKNGSGEMRTLLETAILRICAF